MGAVEATWQGAYAPVLETPAAVRAGLRKWLAVHAWPRVQALDLVCAVNEAVTNCVEHAYPVVGFAGGKVTVKALVVDAGEWRRMSVEVADDGWWRPRAGALGPPGHLGLALVEALVDTLWVRPGEAGDAGTEVLMLSRSVPGLSG